MNETVNLSGLIVRLSEATGADSNTSRRFIRGFFATMAEALAEGEGASVTIPGIGTFVRSAEPADDGQPRVLFQPDPELVENANKPFAMFDPVELAPSLAPTDLADEEPIEPTEPAQSDRFESSDSSDQSESSDQSTPPAPPTPEEEAPIAPSFPEEDEDFDTVAPLPQPPRKRRSAWPWIIAVGIIIGVAVGVWLGFTMDVDLPEPVLEEQIEGTDQSDITTPEATGEEARQTPETSEPEPQPAVATAEIVNEPAQTTAAQPEEVYETFSATNYLSTMARRHYNAQIYWVYIYEANADRLGHPDHVAPGTRILIPPASSLPHFATEAEARRAAEAKAREIYARFNR